MRQTAFERYLENFLALNPLERGILRARIRRVSFAAGEVILHQGDPCRRILFLERGLARTAILDEEGRDRTWAFHYTAPEAELSNLFLVDYESFLTRTPSSLHIEAIEACECVAIDYDAQHLLYRRSAKFQELGRRMAEEAYRYTHRLLLDLRTKSPRTRYREFLTRYPGLTGRVPQYHIATFLGITPQHLSRLLHDDSQM